jgi:hypothetical protein
MTQLSTKLSLDQLLTKWPAALNPLLAWPIWQGNQINNVVLTANKPTAINHLLQRMPQGWFLVDNTADVIIWRASAYTNTTLTLEASSDTTISLWIY